MASGLPLIQVDAFARQPFTGNPAAVCFLDHARDDRWLQTVASQMNLSETAFLLPLPDGFSLRWFSPTKEVDLCGHATLASAHALWEQRILTDDVPARFHTRSGLLQAARRGDKIELDFPTTPPVHASPPPGLAQALGAEPLTVARSRFDFLLELASEEEVKGLRPDFNSLAALPIRGVIVTSRSSTAGYDFVSRFFAPAVGIDEDPATGSSHCCLAPFWAERLGKTEMLGYQASARGGFIGVRLAGERVFLTGHAVTIWRGELLV
ncbi:MAG TPA: PhzF family phenazine biosynthesis protein [Gemmataceae bacterium]|jgi:PhzF family phenazine biosynthesis protein|nr:PhzF family phenazine biosynthesis protein [Gemmataceae bacterium]